MIVVQAILKRKEHPMEVQVHEVLEEITELILPLTEEEKDSIKTIIESRHPDYTLQSIESITYQ